MRRFIGNLLRLISWWVSPPDQVSQTECDCYRRPSTQSNVK